MASLTDGTFQGTLNRNPIIPTVPPSPGTLDMSDSLTGRDATAQIQPAPTAPIVATTIPTSIQTPTPKPTPTTAPGGTYDQFGNYTPPTTTKTSDSDFALGGKLNPDTSITPPDTATLDAATNSYVADGKYYKIPPRPVQLAADQAKTDALHTANLTAMTNLSNGITPLKPEEQAQIDGLKLQYQELIDAQKLQNISASGTANIRGYQRGAAEYDPSFQTKTIGTIITAGANKIADLNIKMASAVAQLTMAFRNNDIANIKTLDETLRTNAKERQDTLQKVIDDAQKAVKDAQDARIAADKVVYDTITKPIQDVQADVLKNTGNTELATSIGKAKTVSEAISLAGNSLQTATGDPGAYLFEKRNIESSGGVAPSYESWRKTLEQSKLNTEIAKIRATKGIEFEYNVALEKAKNIIANAETPNYSGEFANTIKLAAQAGSTNVQRIQIKNDLQDFISQGDYKSAYTQILSSAGNKLTGANASNFQQQNQSYGALKDMRDVLKDAQAAGINTNIFKGGVDAVQTKIGVLATDPRYAALATRLDSAFHQYRQNMTGAAFGVAESAEYASVLPSAGNTFALNMAKIDGATQYLNAVIENTIKNTIGEGGIYIKQYAEAGDNVKQEQEKIITNIADWINLSDTNMQAYRDAKEMFPDATPEELSQQLGL